jgi:hypothetical protein
MNEEDNGERSTYVEWPAAIGPQYGDLDAVEAKQSDLRKI